MRYISLPVMYTQSYGTDLAGNPQKYSESFSIGKIFVGKQNIIKLVGIKQFIHSVWKKRGGDVVPKIGFFLSDSIEKSFYPNQHLRVLNGIDLNIITPTSEDDVILSSSDISELPKRLAYYDVQISSLLDYNNLNCYKTIGDNREYQFPVSQNHSVIGDVTLLNTKSYDYLYIVPYCPLLLQSEALFSGNLIFSLVTGD